MGREVRGGKGWKIIGKWIALGKERFGFGKCSLMHSNKQTKYLVEV